MVRTLFVDHLNTDDLFLLTIGGETLDQTRKRFQHLDRDLQTLEAESIIADRLKDDVPYGIDHGPKSGYTDEALIRNELGKKRHIPIRRLVRGAGGALQALKPVWLMSPHSLCSVCSARYGVFRSDRDRRSLADAPGIRRGRNALEGGES